METKTMNQQTFEAELKRDGYDVITNTTPSAKAVSVDIAAPQPCAPLPPALIAR